MNKTVIRKSKRPDGVGRWPAYLVVEDAFGAWLYSPKGTIYRGRTGSIVTECQVGQGNGPTGLAVMHLAPKMAWWFAAWHIDGDSSIIAVDICTPPVQIGDEWKYTDLELDPHAFSDGRVEIQDEDEFLAACDAGLIAPDEAAEAQAATKKIMQQLRDREEPFGRVGWQRLQDAFALRLPPITTLDDEQMA